MRRRWGALPVMLTILFTACTDVHEDTTRLEVAVPAYRATPEASDPTEFPWEVLATTTTVPAAAARPSSARRASRAATSPRRDAPRVEGGGGTSGDVWAALRACESNGYGDKRNPRYRGAYQFSWATWASVGGTGDPADAPPEEQDRRAQMLQARSGWGQWPRCSKRLGLR